MQSTSPTACAIPQTYSHAATSVITMRLYAAGEIQQRLRVSRQRAYQIISRKDFPDPVAELQVGRIWLASDVEAWIAQHRPHLNEVDET